jgi:hypothetical protein
MQYFSMINFYFVDNSYWSVMTLKAYINVIVPLILCKRKLLLFVSFVFQ